jgi:uncharacterized protein DUF4352
MKLVKPMAGVIAVAALAAATAGCAATEPASSSSVSASTGGPKTTKTKSDACTTRATRKCTPTVSRDGHVRVDALNWRVTDVQTAETIGDQSYGGGAQAAGIYVIATLKVTSRQDKTVDLGTDTVKLDTGGESYDVDTDAAIGFEGTPKPLLFEQIGPDVTKSMRVAFDVPKSAVNGPLKLRFNELGFGETHGFINVGTV